MTWKMTSKSTAFEGGGGLYIYIYGGGMTEKRSTLEVLKQAL